MFTREKNRAFTDLLRRIEQRSECKKLPLKSFLVLPIQRVARFPILMKSAMEQLDPMEKDYMRAMGAFDASKKVQLLELISISSNVLIA